MKSNRLLSLVFSLALLAGICLGIGLAAWVVLNLPGWAETQFGPSAPGLSEFQKTVLSAQILRQADALKIPADLNGEERDFQVELGESPTAIIAHLRQEGMIPDASAFRNYLVYAGLDTTIQAGNYRLSARMSPLEIAQALQDATPSEVAFNVLPGWRIEEIAAALPTSGLTFTPEIFLKTAANLPANSPLLAEMPQGATIEGFLFPDNYTISRQVTPQGFVDALIDNFQSKLTADIRQGFSRQDLSLFDAVSLASIVQREAVVPEEMPMIASVYLNRLQTGMKLDADPTVQYALGYNPTQNSWWTNPLSQADLQVNSPYNTYLNWGLPPGPISNPGLQALQAVAFPAQTPYYFFRAACDGSGKHLFAETFEQHVANACP